MFLDVESEGDYILEVELGVSDAAQRQAVLRRFRQMLRGHAMHGTTPPSAHVPASVLDGIRTSRGRSGSGGLGGSGGSSAAVHDANAMYDAAHVAGAVGRNVVQYAYARQAVFDDSSAPSSGSPSPALVTADELRRAFASQPFVVDSIISVAQSVPVRWPCALGTTTLAHRVLALVGRRQWVRNPWPRG